MVRRKSVRMQHPQPVQCSHSREHGLRLQPRQQLIAHGVQHRWPRLQVMRIPDALYRAQADPTAFAMARPVQCVTCPGGSEQVSARIFATVTVVSFAVPGGRVLPCSKASTPASAYRICQRHTAGRLTSALRATSATANLSSDSNTIRGRWMCFCGRFRSATIKPNASDRYHQRQRKLPKLSAQSARNSYPRESSVRVSALITD